MDYLLTGKHPAEKVGDKTWTFSHEAKTEYPDLRHIVTHANEAVKVNDTSLLRSTLIGVAERLKNIEGQQVKEKKNFKQVGNIIYINFKRE